MFKPLRFKPEDFMVGEYIRPSLSFTEAAQIANQMLEEDEKKRHIFSWPITGERYRQVLAKMRRQSRRIRELEEQLEKYNENI